MEIQDRASHTTERSVRCDEQWSIGNGTMRHVGKRRQFSYRLMLPQYCRSVVVLYRIVLPD